MNKRLLRLLEKRYGPVAEPMIAVLGVLSAHRSGLRNLTPTDFSEFSWLQPGRSILFGFSAGDEDVIERQLPFWLRSSGRFEKAWAQIVAIVGPPQLAILLEEETPELLGSLATLLARRSLQTSAVYVEAGAPRRDRMPTWPLVIASPPSQRGRISALIEDLPDGAEQARWRPLKGTASTDLLVIPPKVTFVPGASGVQARQLASSAMAIAFAPARAGDANTMSFGLRLRYGLETEAVAVARASGKKRDDFCLAFMAELSQGRSFAEAITLAGREHLDRPPFLLSSSSFLEQMRLPPRDAGRSFNKLLELAEEFGKKSRDEELSLSEELARTLRMERTRLLAPELAVAVRDFLATRGPEGAEELPATYAKLRRTARSRERVAPRRYPELGTPLSMHTKGPKAPVQRSEPRHLHANIISTEGREETPIFHPLIAGTAYRVDVHIGPTDAQSNFLATPFPEEQLSPSQDAHTLTVVFADLSAGRPEPLPPRSAQLQLGREGPSTRCSFEFTAPPAEAREAGRFAARILVLYRNRVLQTALLSAPVVVAEQRGSVPGGVLPELELAPTASLEKLGERTDFDALLVLNHDVEGAPRIMGVEGGSARWIHINNRELDEIVQKVRGRIDQVTREELRPNALDDQRLVNLLIMLANQGRFLWERVIDSPQVSDGLRHGHRIQVLEARWGTFLPVEFFYEFPAPKSNAKLCPEALQALKKGQCTASHHHDKETGRGYVCPLGFWGLSRIIERQEADETLAAPGDVGLMPAPPPAPHEIPLLRKGVVGTSHRVDEVQTGSSLQLVHALQTLWPGCVQMAESWQAWASAVQKVAPSLLVLVVHTASDEVTDMPTLEIAKESLGLMELEAEHVRNQSAQGGVLVLLMGCSTALPSVKSQSFVSRMLRLSGGSAVVVSSIARMLGRYAAPTTTTLLQRLSTMAKQESLNVGQAFVRLRRELLAGGDPLMLCLALYGDTDWKLVVPSGD